MVSTRYSNMLLCIQQFTLGMWIKLSRRRIGGLQEYIKQGIEYIYLVGWVSHYANCYRPYYRILSGCVPSAGACSYDIRGMAHSLFAPVKLKTC